MKVNKCKSQWSPALNAKIMRGIERLVCGYRDSLLNGWRCCIEFQDNSEQAPNYLLDIESNQGGGVFAPVKMETLKLFPEQSATGNISLPMITNALVNSGVDDAFFEYLIKLHDVSELTHDDWIKLKDFGITHWYGGIRIPYDILFTQMLTEPIEDETPDQDVQDVAGEIRITFSGAKEWQDVFFCFRIFQKIQTVLNEKWDDDQIWYNLRGFIDPTTSFWISALGVYEAPENK